MPITNFSLKTRIAQLRKSESGAAIAEFGIIAPILIFSALTALDLGLAFSSKMEVDQVVRAGGAAAIESASEEKIEEVMLGADPGPLDVSAERFCSCPDGAEGETVDCTSICPGPAAPYVFYKLTAQRTYDGILLHSVALESAARIQVR
jgi:hypothetical protein